MWKLELDVDGAFLKVVYIPQDLIGPIIPLKKGIPLFYDPIDFDPIDFRPHDFTFFIGFLLVLWCRR